MKKFIYNIYIYISFIMATSFHFSGLWGLSMASCLVICNRTHSNKRFSSSCCRLLIKSAITLKPTNWNCSSKLVISFEILLKSFVTYVTSSANLFRLELDGALAMQILWPLSVRKINNIHIYKFYIFLFNTNNKQTQNIILTKFQVIL